MSEIGPDDEDLARIKKAVSGLIEHFDSVQIFCSRCTGSEGGDTLSAQWGAGNYYARIAQAREWILRDDEITREDVRKGTLKEGE